MIPFTDLRGDAALQARDRAAFERVRRSPTLILGPEVEAFEAAWAEVCGVRHAVGVGNGLDAIEIGLRTLDTGPGDEVITTSMTAFATVLAVLHCGATPVFADIDPDTANLCPLSVERCLSPRTRALLPVHLYGRAGPAPALQALCAAHGIALIEDCAQAHLAQLNDRCVGSFGRCAAWSFYPTKNLGALGDAGALTTDDDEIAARARHLRNYGQSSRYVHDEIGLNSRLDELQAAVLRDRLPRLPAWTRRRQEIAATYHAELAAKKVVPMAPPEQTQAHVQHLFVVRCAERDALARHLAEQGVQTLIHYPIPAHLQAPCRDAPMDPKGLPATEEHAATCLSLPCHPGLDDGDLTRIIAAVASFEAA